MEFDFDEDVKIDETALDVEWLNQAALARRYGKHVAFLRRQVWNAEEKKKTIRSELILEVNEDPEGLIGKKKPNAADIEAYYRNSPRYKEAIVQMHAAREELELAEVAKAEIAFTRKKALEHLVILHGQMYFAGPNVPRDLSHEAAKFRANQEANAAVSKSMRRTT